LNDNKGNVSTWTYVNNVPNPVINGINFTVVKTDPGGNQTVNYFSGEYLIQMMSYNGGCPTSITGCTGGGIILRTITTCYNGAFTTCLPSSFPLIQLPISQTDVYTSYNGSSSSSLVETKVDTTYGNTLEVKGYGFGAAMPPSGTPASDTII